VNVQRGPLPNPARPRWHKQDEPPTPEVNTVLQLPPTLRDLLTLAARLLLGVVLLAHGYQKLVGQGLGATSASFARLGVPLPGLSAAFAGCVETGGGLLLVLGLLTPVAAALVTVVMLGAGYFAGHWFGGVTGDDGWELVGVIIAGVLLLAAAGPGRFSLDHVLAQRRERATVGV
jgi:putative oxidoreductase